MSDSPMVSVLTVTFNQVEFVEEALVTVFEQDYDDMEVVIADDGSTDGTVTVIREVMARFPHRKVRLIDGPHVGMVANFNRALRDCRGRYIAFQAGDDVYLPGKLREQVAWLEADPARVLCGHDVAEFDSRTGKTLFLHSNLAPLRAGRGARAAVRAIPYCGIANVVRASAIPAHGFDARLRYVIDWKLWIEALAGGAAYGYVPGVFAKRRRHERNVSNYQALDALKERVADVLTMLSLVECEYPSLLKECRLARADQLYSLAAWLLHREGDSRSSRAYSLAALAQSQGRCAKAYAVWCLSWLPVSMRTGFADRWLQARQRRRARVEGI